MIYWVIGVWDSGLKIKTQCGEGSDSGIVLDDVNIEKVDKDVCSRDVARTALDSACVYGPNSPRSKDKVSTEESAIVSALSEYASHGSFVSGFTQFDSVQDAAGEADMEDKPVKRLGSILLFVAVAIYFNGVFWILYIIDIHDISICYHYL